MFSRRKILKDISRALLKYKKNYLPLSLDRFVSFKLLWAQISSTVPVTGSLVQTDKCNERFMPSLQFDNSFVHTQTESPFNQFFPSFVKKSVNL